MGSRNPFFPRCKMFHFSHEKNNFFFLGCHFFCRPFLQKYDPRKKEEESVKLLWGHSWHCVRLMSPCHKSVFDVIDIFIFFQLSFELTEKPFFSD
jgi:hypothetical protein